MIITVDGYDGTGKTTLATNIAKAYGFLYVDKPIIRMFQSIYRCDYDTAKELLAEKEKHLWSRSENPDPVERNRNIIKFYTEPMLWLKNIAETNPNHLLSIMGEPLLPEGQKLNIAMDRGILTTYACVGDDTNKDLFDEYIRKGAFMDVSIYLTADDNERVRRIYERDPSDPDLKRDPKWRDNDLEPYAESRGLNIHKIPTDGRTTDEVFAEARKVLDPMILGTPTSGVDGNDGMGD